MLTTDIRGQTVIHVCRPTRHPKQVPALKKPAPPAPVAASALTRWFRCASEGCEATVELDDLAPLPAGWCTQTAVGLKGAGPVRYLCPVHSPLRPPAHGALRRARRKAAAS